MSDYQFQETPHGVRVTRPGEDYPAIFAATREEAERLVEIDQQQMAWDGGE